MSEDPAAQLPQPYEPHAPGLAGRLNWLRAGVLGANDGIVSVAGIVVGVAGATTDRGPIVTAGVAGLVAGAVSMALGEYVSVSSQRDTERALLAKERRGAARSSPRPSSTSWPRSTRPRDSPETARAGGEELTEHDALAAHAEVELGIDPDDLTNPWHAAGASAVAFALGALLPLVAILLPPATSGCRSRSSRCSSRSAITGAVSARIGGSDPRRRRPGW